MMEVSIIISLIFTVGHFLFLWGSYIEKKFALVSFVQRFLNVRMCLSRKVGQAFLVSQPRIR